MASDHPGREVDTAGALIGRRLREVRVWRGLSLRAVAELAGLSAGYLSRTERGERPVERRSTLEALARALRVAPSELAQTPRAAAGVDVEVADAVAAMTDVEAALTDVAVGEATVTPRAWPVVAADVVHLNDRLRLAADYRGQMALLPRLVAELNAHLHTDAPRREVLEALMHVYQAAAMGTKYLGARGLPAVAALHARHVAERLDDPAWCGLAVWMRALTLGSGSRDRMRELSTAAADGLGPHLGGRRDVRELYGALHLNAGLAAAALDDADTARAHLEEAQQTAESMPEVPGTGFGHLSFGRMNVRIWWVALAVELGEHGRVRELSRTIEPRILRSRTRQASYWADLGRGLAAGRGDRDDAVGALLTAERIAPVKTRANPFVRDTVTHLLPRVRRESAGRELRGLAFRMGLAG